MCPLLVGCRGCAVGGLPPHMVLPHRPAGAPWYLTHSAHVPSALPASPQVRRPEPPPRMTTRVEVCHLGDWRFKGTGTASLVALSLARLGGRPCAMEAVREKGAQLSRRSGLLACIVSLPGASGEVRAAWLEGHVRSEALAHLDSETGCNRAAAAVAAEVAAAAGVAPLDHQPAAVQRGGKRSGSGHDSGSGGERSDIEQGRDTGNAHGA